jgi:hypothetical protein
MVEFLRLRQAPAPRSARELVLHKTESFQAPAIIADIGPEAAKRFFRILHGHAGGSIWLWKESVTRLGYCQPCKDLVSSYLLERPAGSRMADTRVSAEVHRNRTPVPHSGTRWNTWEEIAAHEPAVRLYLLRLA